MATKDQLLSLLRNSRGNFLSGEEIARSLGISRAAVCKAAKALREQGLPIEAVTHKGYRLSEDNDCLSPEGILPLLSSDFYTLSHESSVDSTNSRLRELAMEGAAEGTVLLADRQTKGRGRMGRSFFSPEGSGIYLSLLLRPQDLTPKESLQITTMAAAALCLAIEETTGKHPGIKWVNDLLLDGRKIAGILTEASFSMETGMVDYAVLGLGLNIYAPQGGFPEDLREIAGFLCEKSEESLKNRLTAGFLNHFADFYRNRKFQQAAEVYKDRSLLIGKQILAENKQAVVLDINDRCQLVVQYADGTGGELSYGEVTIVNQSSLL